MMFESILGTVTEFFRSLGEEQHHSSSGGIGDGKRSEGGACCGARPRSADLKRGRSPRAVSLPLGVNGEPVFAPKGRVLGPRGSNKQSGKRTNGRGLLGFLRGFGASAASPLRQKRENERRKLARSRIIKELVETERKYVRDLRIMLNLFYEPIKEKKLMKDKDSLQIFASIPLMLNVNVALLDSLEQEQTVDTNNNGDTGVPLERICNAFHEIIPYFKLYSSWIASFEGNASRLAKLRSSKPKLRKYLEKCVEREETRGLDLDSYYIKPVQRLLKYPLFFRDLVKKTRPRNKLYAKLLKVQTMMESIASNVNESTRQRQASEQAFSTISRIEAGSSKLTIALRQRLTEAHRKLIISYRSVSDKDPFSLILFSDLILLVKKNKKSLRLVAESNLEDMTWAIKGRRLLMSEKRAGKGLIPFAALYIDAEDGNAHGHKIILPPGDIIDLEVIIDMLDQTQKEYLSVKEDLELRRGTDGSADAAHKESDIRRWVQISRGDLKSLAVLRARYVRRMSDGKPKKTAARREPGHTF